MITEEKFFGGATERSISADLQLTRGSKRVQFIDPTGAGFAVVLPDATELEPGGPRFYIFNVDAGAISIDIKDNANNVLATVAAGDAILLSLADNSDAAGLWFQRISTFGGG